MDEAAIFTLMAATARVIARRHAARVLANGGAFLLAYHRAFERVLARLIAT